MQFLVSDEYFISQWQHINSASALLETKLKLTVILRTNKKVCL